MQRKMSTYETIVARMRNRFWAGKVLNPIPDYPVTFKYGVKSDRYAAGHHTGEDHSTAGKVGVPVYALRRGIVVSQNPGSSYGKVCVVEFTSRGRTYRAYYCHLDSINVRVGSHVKRGTILGRSGNTGNSTGPHLHLEVRAKRENASGILFGYGTDVHPSIYKRKAGSKA